MRRDQVIKATLLFIPCYILVSDCISEDMLQSQMPNMAKIKDKVAKNNFEIYDVPYDGNCMFTSFAHQLGCSGEAANIRAEIVVHMKKI